MYHVKNPIVLFGYNKPDTTKRVLSEILKVSPKKLYLILDGPKSYTDQTSNDETKNIFEKISNEIEIVKDYSNSNLGLKKRFKSGLDKVFNDVSQAIILEDDTLPSQSFFRFCDEMLEKYKDKKEIAQVSGFNYFTNMKQKSDYYFTTTTDIWGWATWSDRWFRYYNDDLYLEWNHAKNDKLFIEKFVSKKEYDFYYQIFDNAVSGRIDSWEIQWLYSLRKNNMKNIVPDKNLVKNIGFGHENATHTHQKLKYLSLTKNIKMELKFPLIHPKNIELNPSIIAKEIDKRLLENSKLSKAVYVFKKVFSLK